MCSERKYADWASFLISFYYTTKYEIKKDKLYNYLDKG